MASILASVYRWIERQPDKLLYAFLDADGRTKESCTYAAFLQRTTDIAGHIRRVSRLSPGDRVLLAFPPGLEMICAFFACVRLGLIPVPVYPPAGRGFQAARDKAGFIARDCQAAAVLTDRRCYWSMRLNEARQRVRTWSFTSRDLSKLTWIVTTDAAGGRDGAALPEAHSEVLFLQYTSGSTREPRGVMVTHDNILDNCAAVVDHQPVGVSWLPQYHDMGLIGYYLFFAIAGGTTYGFSPVDFIQRPALWLQTISRYRGTATSAPNFAYEYCTRPDKLPDEALTGLDLSSLRFVMNAAEPVRAGVCRDFLHRFSPLGLNPKSFFAAYGLAEYTLAVSNYGRAMRAFDRSALCEGKVQPIGSPASDAAATLVSCGVPLGTTEIRIVDVNGAPQTAAPGTSGEIWIRGGSKCPGYWGRPELNAATFDAHLPGEPGTAPGWLRSGDVGFMYDGELYVCGRLKDMVIVRGLNYYPQDIEAIVEADPLVRKGCVAAFAADGPDRERLVIVAEVRRPDHVPDIAALNQRLRAALGITADTVVCIKARTIPKTSSGKIARHLARRYWSERSLAIIRTFDWTPDAGAADAEQPRALLTRFGLTGRETWTLAEAGLDSMSLVEFAQALKTDLDRRGAPDVSRSVDLRVLQKVAICDLFDLLDELTAATPYAAHRLGRALAALAREYRTAEAALMRTDSRLRFDPPLMPPAPRASGVRRPGVLLTGGTGFFGPFLLASLLEQCPDDIHVLVRAATDEEALRRIGEGLASIAPDGRTPHAGWQDRVRPVRGDLAAPDLGLDHLGWRALAEGVHTIFHNGALVNYLFDYASMRDPNVGGTNEVVRLAMTQGAILNYISTTFVFGWSVKETLFESDTNAAMDHLDFGYSQTKWVSEQVVRDAMARGLPARIFRPALLTPSVHGGGFNFDISIRLLAFMLNHGIGTTARNQVSFTPADVAAANIVAIARHPDAIGATYHVTRDDYASMADITAILTDLTGRRFRDYPLDAFVPEVIARCRPGDILFPLIDFLVRSVENITAMEFKRYDNARYRQMRAGAACAKPDPPLGDVVLGILRFMRRQGLVNV
jgi:thioester reductase-like protein